ncbi:hypothetical protein JCM8208_004406 [Rhodotorula glutinis]
MPKTPAQNKAKKAADEGGYVEWTIFYKVERERLKAEHPDWAGPKIKTLCGEAYRKQKDEALARQAE